MLISNIEIFFLKFCPLNLGQVQFRGRPLVLIWIYLARRGIHLYFVTSQSGVAEVDSTLREVVFSLENQIEALEKEKKQLSKKIIHLQSLQSLFNIIGIQSFFCFKIVVEREYCLLFN